MKQFIVVMCLVVIGSPCLARETGYLDFRLGDRKGDVLSIVRERYSRCRITLQESRSDNVTLVEILPPAPEREEMILSFMNDSLCRIIVDLPGVTGNGYQNIVTKLRNRYGAPLRTDAALGFDNMTWDVEKDRCYVSVMNIRNHVRITYNLLSSASLNK